VKRLYGEPFGVPVYVDRPPGAAGRFILADDHGTEHRFDDYADAVRFVARMWVLRLFGGTRH